MTIVSDVCDNMLLNDKLDADALAGSPLAINGMKLLRYALDNDGITLTKSGAFNRKCVAWATEEFQWPRYTPDYLYLVNKVLNEDDFLPLGVLHDLLMAARLLRKYKGKALLRKTAQDILGNHGALQTALFETYFTRFDFTNFERFVIPVDYSDHRHFLGVVDNRLHDWTPVIEFAGWCLPIYADERHGYGRREDMIFFVLGRSVRPLKWLGLIEEKETGTRHPRLDEIEIRKTALFNKFIRFVDIRPVTAYTQ